MRRQLPGELCCVGGTHWRIPVTLFHLANSMLFVFMTKAANDDDTWISIGVQAALILNKLRNSVELTEVEQTRQEGDDGREGDGVTKDENPRRALV
jgi:hypothetical protein